MQIYGFDGYFPKQRCFCFYINRVMLHLVWRLFFNRLFYFFSLSIFFFVLPLQAVKGFAACFVAPRFTWKYFHGNRRRLCLKAVALTNGMVLEWLKRHAWKACNQQNRFGGSNPPHSANFS